MDASSNNNRLSQGDMELGQNLHKAPANWLHVSFSPGCLNSSFKYLIFQSWSTKEALVPCN